ncbi:hypothetical protein [Nocardia sp. NBC_00416]|uniref:hypothetical protein n=1 Tax=Nocardia sp. NBC_00416 TaxID=2975991 RepID=UPI002E1B0D77
MAVSNNAARHRARPTIRAVRRAAIAAAGLAGAVSLLSAPAADAAGPAPAATPAAAAVRALTSPVPGTDIDIPVDFRAVAGYRPALVDGLLVAPHGSCSSPVPLPVEFETACQAHDLGYDLLRYAGEQGSPLGPWARQELDRALAERMHAACTRRAALLPRTRCDAMAEVAAVAVDLNSMRQDYGVPVVEDFPVADTVAAWLPRISAVLLLAFAALLLRRRSVAAPLLPYLPRRRPDLSYAVTTGSSHV